MKWDDEKHNQLIKEMFVARPQEYKSGSIQRGSAWEEIVKVLNLLDVFFFVNQGPLRDRYSNLVCNNKQTHKDENASGINSEHTEMDDFFEELDSLFKESERAKDKRLDEKKNRRGQEKILKSLTSVIGNIFTNQKREERRRGSSNDKI